MHASTLVMHPLAACFSCDYCLTKVLPLGTHGSRSAYSHLTFCGFVLEAAYMGDDDQGNAECVLDCGKTHPNATTRSIGWYVYLSGWCGATTTELFKLPLPSEKQTNHPTKGPLPTKMFGEHLCQFTLCCCQYLHVEFETELITFYGSVAISLTS